MFLANAGNIVQALDARNGELIWENRIGEADALQGALMGVARLTR